MRSCCCRRTSTCSVAGTTESSAVRTPEVNSSRCIALTVGGGAVRHQLVNLRPHRGTCDTGARMSRTRTKTRVRLYREGFGFTQAEVSKATGIPRRTLQRLESGDVVNPRIGDLASLAHFYDRSRVSTRGGLSRRSCRACHTSRTLQSLSSGSSTSASVHATQLRARPFDLASSASISAGTSGRRRSGTCSPRSFVTRSRSGR